MVCIEIDQNRYEPNKIFDEQIIYKKINKIILTFKPKTVFLFYFKLFFNFAF